MTAPQRQPGRLGRALIRMLMKQAGIAAAEDVAPGFRLLTLESPEFKGIAWTPGQKVQIAMGSAFVARTFTPIEWDAAAGRTRILGYTHGAEPGSDWIRQAAPGNGCHVFGPRASLDAAGLAGTPVLFGDETSIGLAYALAATEAGRALQCVLEVNGLADTLSALSQIRLGNTELFERKNGDVHLDDIERRLPPLAASGAAFILTGKASSIQRVKRCLNALNVPSARILSKAYWTLGKTGLD
ncbi:MAG: hypothetical protein GAK35_02010 [Herbaspirillum frisingense]|uniref:FAD-binding FR-type domain-containing protein n=1 Tax=Herbaspirillum frisingense TaxID=92645 RepID=A0A7V8JUG2_9BURK|nr:MAG: hypothetical protein GAK35_02010 [Herbaspirillum frisingense]